MRKILLITTVLAITSIASFGQTSNTGLKPALEPEFWWRSIGGDSTLNFNNASIVGKGDTIVFDSLPYAKDYTMVVVYQSLDGKESSVWRMEYADTVSQGVRELTTNGNEGL